MLPFRNLSPADFERLCLWLIRREGYEPVEHLGASGSEGGRDVVAYRDGQRIAFQCKRTKELGPADAEDEVDKILRLPPEEQPAHLIFVTTCDISATTRKRAQQRAGAIPCAFWAITELDERVKRHDDIIREFFGSRPRRPEIPFIVPVEDVPSFTGRQHELERLAELLLQTDGSRVCGIVGVAGAGGIGKTALAAHFAERHRDGFPDGVIGMRVDGKSPDRVARDFARSSGVPIDEQDERDASTIMQEVFRHRRALLIFDNADAATIRQVLPGGDCCAVVVTTRDRGLAAALGLPNDATVDLPVLPEEEAVLLLRRLLGDPRIDEEPAAARKIGNLIGHLPLALQIVGATLRFRPWRRLEEYAASLAEERSRLAKLRVAQTDLDVRASFALSLRTLDEDVIDFLACLSVCAADGFSVRGAMAATDCDEPLAHDRLGTLCRFSLLNAIPDDGGGFAFHPLVHLFAAELAEERMLKEAAAERHASFFVEWVKASFKAEDKGTAPLTREMGDVLIAAVWLRRSRKADYEFVMALEPVLVRHGLWEQAVELMSGFLALAEQLGNWHAVVQLRIQQAKFYRLRSELDLAEESLAPVEESLEHIELGPVRQRCKAMWLNTLGGIHQNLGRFVDAADALSKSHSLLVESEDQHGQAMVLNSLGGVYQRQGRFDDGIDAFEKSHALLVELEDQRGQAMVLNSLGGVYQRQGRFDDGIDAFEKSYALLDELEDQRGQAMVLNSLGGVYQRQGRFDDSLKAFEESIRIGEDLGDRRHLAMVHTSLGRALLSRNQSQRAVEELRKGFDIDERLKNRRGLTIVTPQLIRALQNLERHDEARAVCQRALAVAPREPKLRQLLERLSSPPPRPLRTKSAHGTVKRILKSPQGSRYGFITPDDGTGDVYFREGIIPLEILDKLRPEMKVEVEVEQGPKGPRARSVTILH